VVGVVRDVHYGSLWQPPEPYLYLDVLQSTEPATCLMIRTHGAPQDLIPEPRRRWDPLRRSGYIA